MSSAPLSARELREALASQGEEIAMRTAYAIMSGAVGISCDKLAALGRARPDLATWGVVMWFADRRQAATAVAAPGGV